MADEFAEKIEQRRSIAIYSIPGVDYLCYNPSRRQAEAMIAPIWLTPSYGVPKGSVWTEDESFVLVYLGERFVIGEPKSNPICETIKALLPKKGQTQMTDTKKETDVKKDTEKKEFDYEGIVKRHEAGSPAAEDIPALIAEVDRLNPSLKKKMESTKEQAEKDAAKDESKPPVKPEAKPATNPGGHK